MNEEQKIRFAYIAGHEHAAASISIWQLNQIKNIIYGSRKTEKKEA
jgi:hypothetical protein